MSNTNKTHTFLGENLFPSDRLADFLTFCYEHDIEVIGIKRMTPIGYDIDGEYSVGVDLDYKYSKELERELTIWFYGCDMKEKYKDKFSEEELERIFGY